MNKIVYSAGEICNAIRGNISQIPDTLHVILKRRADILGMKCYSQLQKSAPKLYRSSCSFKILVLHFLKLSSLNGIHFHIHNGSVSVNPESTCNLGFRSE